jgi:hypothetical protein
MSYVLLITFPLALGASCFLLRHEMRLVMGGGDCRTDCALCSGDPLTS